MKESSVYFIKEKYVSKEEFLDRAIRYTCDLCGATHTTLEIFEDDDVVLCPRCEYGASYEDEKERPDPPVLLKMKQAAAALTNLSL